MSINDIYTEHTFQFMATNVDYLEDIQDIGEIQEPYNILLPKEPDPVFTPIDKTKKDKSDNKYTIPVDKDIPELNGKMFGKKEYDKTIESVKKEIKEVANINSFSEYATIHDALVTSYKYSQQAVKSGNNYSEESLERLENNYNNLRTAAILLYKDEMGQLKK